MDAAPTDWRKRTGLGKSKYRWYFKSTVGKFFSDEDLKTWADKMGAKPGDMLLILSGEAEKTRKQLNELRLEMGRRMGLMKPGDFKPLMGRQFPAARMG